jgi:hypothetical protein
MYACNGMLVLTGNPQPERRHGSIIEPLRKSGGSGGERKGILQRFRLRAYGFLCRNVINVGCECLTEKTTTQGSRIRASTAFPRPAHYRPPYTERPSFPHPIDLSIDVRSGQVTVRSTGKDATEEITTEHIDLRPGLVDGLLLSMAKNIWQIRRGQECP